MSLAVGLSVRMARSFNLEDRGYWHDRRTEGASTVSINVYNAFRLRGVDIVCAV